VSTSSTMTDLSEIRPTRIWADVIARIVQGDRITLAVVEIPPGALVPEHHHEHEQLGLCISGTVNFRVGAEERELGPGGTWRILTDVPHEAQAGPDGAVVVEVFAPVRGDWEGLEEAPGGSPRWPAGG
jgi:quercetin dioxygenase-like cupin family protein